MTVESLQPVFRIPRRKHALKTHANLRAHGIKAELRYAAHGSSEIWVPPAMREAALELAPALGLPPSSLFESETPIDLRIIALNTLTWVITGAVGLVLGYWLGGWF